MDQLFRDLRCAVRNLRRTPGPTLAALLVLSLGVGATGAVYTVVDAVLLEPLPYPEPDGLVMLVDSNPQAGFPRFSTAPPDFADWRREATSFDGMAAFTRADLVLDDPESEPQRSVPALLAAAVGLLATWIPARRAVRVDPLVALRSE